MENNNDSNKMTRGTLSREVRNVGPVAMEDTNGEPLHFIGEITFKITIEGRTMTVSAWVTNEIKMGQLILGSRVPEDLNLQLYNIPDVLSFRGHAEDTVSIKDPRGCSPVTRASKLWVPSRDISHSQSHPSNAFLVPFKHGFHREIVKSATGRKTVYYITAEGVRLESKKKLIPHIKHLENITVENFNFVPIELPIVDPLNKYQSTRPADPSHRSTSRAIPQGSYQSTDDSAQSAEETRQFREADYHWDQDTCWEAIRACKVKNRLQ